MMGRTSKYHPLSQYLKKQAEAGVSTVRISFVDIEQIIGTDLPPTARNRVQWWANSRTEKSRQCNSWMNYNWETEQVDIPNESLVFRNISV